MGWVNVGETETLSRVLERNPTFRIMVEELTDNCRNQAYRMEKGVIPTVHLSQQDDSYVLTVSDNIPYRQEEAEHIVAQLNSIASVDTAAQITTALEEGGLDQACTVAATPNIVQQQTGGRNYGIEYTGGRGINCAAAASRKLGGSLFYEVREYTEEDGSRQWRIVAVARGLRINETN